MDYRTAGVDVVAGRAFVERIRSSVETTRRPEVLGWKVRADLTSGHQVETWAEGAEGRQVRIGAPLDVLTPQTIRETFAVEAAIDRHPVTDRPRFSFHSSNDMS